MGWTPDIRPTSEPRSRQMKRVIAIVTAAYIALLLVVPVAAAADPFDTTDALDGTVVVTVNGDMTFGADQRADTLVVVDGSATVAGEVGTLVLIDSQVRLTGSHTSEIVSISSQVSLDGATT